MSTAVEPASRGKLRASVVALTIAAWLGLLTIVLSLDPDPLLHRIAFFVVFFLAVSGATSLGAYQLSFQLFASKRYRGNLVRSLQQGAIAGGVLTLAAVLQVERALSPITGGLLGVLFVALQIVVLMRR